MPERTVDYIVELRSELVEVWQRAHSNWKEWVKFFDGEHEIRAFDATEKRVLSRARAKVEAMVDTMVTDNPRVERRPQGEGEAHKALADKVEKVGSGILRKGAQKWGLVPPFKTAAKFLTLLGYTVMVVRHDSNQWPQKPKKGIRGYREKLEQWERERRNAFPWVLESPYPARVLLSPTEREPTFAVESATMYNWEIERDYGLEPRNGKPMGLTDTILYTDRDRIQMVIDREMVINKPNVYNKVFYTHAFSGWGMEHPSDYALRGGLSLGPNPEDLAVGLLAGQEDEITAADELITAVLHLALLYSYQTIYLPHGISSDEFQEARKKANLGGAFSLPEGISPQDIRYGDLPKMEPWIFQVLQTFLTNFEQGTFSGVVQGERVAGVSTATQHAMMLGSARLKFGLPLQQLNYMAGQCLGYTARMIDVRGEEVWVDGLPVKGKDFEGNYDFEVDFMAEDEASQMRKTAQGLEMFKVGARSLEQLIADSGESDVTGEKRKILVGKMLNDPALLNQVRQLAMMLVQQKRGITLPPEPQPTGPGPTLAGPGPAPFITPPGGPQEAQQVQRGMTAIPGQGMERAI